MFVTTIERVYLLIDNLEIKLKTTFASVGFDGKIRAPFPQTSTVSEITHLWLLKGVREAALVPAPHLGCQFWVLHVSAQRHLSSTVGNIDWRPVARGNEEVDMISSSLSPHQVLRATHHLDRGLIVRKCK